MNRIVFFGSGDYTIPVVEMLRSHGLVLSITTEHDGPFVSYHKKNNIPLLITDLKNTNDLQTIQDTSAPLAVLASYGEILPQNVIDSFSLGILNIHPSLLPKYKGPSPIQTTILSGDTKTGVTIIQLDDQVDHGPIIAQKEIPLNGSETTQHLKKQLFALGALLVKEILEKIEAGQMPPARTQEHGLETFTEKITREDGFVDVEQPPNPIEIDRMIRAYYPWPGTWTQAKLLGNLKRIKLLPEKKIQVEGKKIMTYKDFINGYGENGKTILSCLGLS